MTLSSSHLRVIILPELGSRCRGRNSASLRAASPTEACSVFMQPCFRVSFTSRLYWSAGPKGALRRQCTEAALSASANTNSRLLLVDTPWCPYAPRSSQRKWRQAPGCHVSKLCQVPECLQIPPFHFQNKWNSIHWVEALFVCLSLCFYVYYTPWPLLRCWGPHCQAGFQMERLANTRKSVASISSEMLIIF